MQAIRKQSKESAEERHKPHYGNNRSLQKHVNRNNCVSFNFANIQTKLKISHPDDIYEQEANRISRQVVSGLNKPFVHLSRPTKQVNRKCNSCEERDEEKEKMNISRKGTTSNNPSVKSDVSSDLQKDISNTISQRGSSLDPSSRKFMESRFGYGFDKVRIHTDSIALKSAQSLNARAYTIGNNVVFAEGQYNPNTIEGKKLLAHELTHVVQQNTSSYSTVKGKFLDRGQSSKEAQSFPIIQRSLWDDLKEGASNIVSGVEEKAGAAWEATKKTVGETVSGIEEKAGAAWEATKKTVGGAWEATKETVGGAWEAVKRAFDLLANLAVNPLSLPAIMGGIAWNLIPETFKGTIINKILDVCILLVDHIPGSLPQITFIWPLMKHALLGFLRQARSRSNEEKIKIMNKFSRLAVYGSREFMMGYLIGIVGGLVDGIVGPILFIKDLAVLIYKIDTFLVSYIWSNAKSLLNTQENLRRIQVFQRNWANLKDHVQKAINVLKEGKITPLKIISLIQKAYEMAISGAESAGAKIADALFQFFEKPDYDLGHTLGEITGTVLLQVLFAYFSAGISAAAPALAKFVATLGRGIGRIGKLFEGMGEALPFLIDALQAIAKFARENETIQTLVRFAKDILEALFGFIKLLYGIEGSAEKGAIEKVEQKGSSLGKHTISGVPETVPESIIEKGGVHFELPGNHKLVEEGNGLFWLCSDVCLRVKLSAEEVRLLQSEEGGRVLREQLSKEAQQVSQTLEIPEIIAEETGKVPQSSQVPAGPLPPQPGNLWSGPKSMEHLRSHVQHARDTARRLGLPRPEEIKDVQEFLWKVIQTGEQRIAFDKQLGRVQISRLGDALVVRRGTGEYVTNLDMSKDPNYGGYWTGKWKSGTPPP